MSTTFLPPLPPFDGLHPIVVHFPIALLLTAPIFVVLAVLSKRLSRAMMLSALVMCIVGTASAFLATSTGSAAEEFAERVPGAKATLEEHEELAELARNLFLGVTVFMAVLTGIYCRFFERAGTAARIIGAAVLLAAYAAPALVLANAAHLGGQLVHVHGVHAPMATQPAGMAASESTPRAPKADGDKSGGKEDRDDD